MEVVAVEVVEVVAVVVEVVAVVVDVVVEEAVVGVVVDVKVCIHPMYKMKMNVQSTLVQSKLFTQYYENTKISSLNIKYERHFYVQ